MTDLIAGILGLGLWAVMVILVALHERRFYDRIYGPEKDDRWNEP